MTRRSCRKDAANGVISSINEQPNKDSEDAGFCGEPFADNGELLSSLSPLLFSMKLCGLYFHRENWHRRRSDDPECNPVTTKTGTFLSGLRVYATIVLFLVWLNAVRLFSLFGRNDHFGAPLLMKITVFAVIHLSAIMYTACYFASHTGKLYKVLLTLPVTPDCVTGARRVAVGVTAIIWIASIVNLSILAFIHLSTRHGEYDFTFAPFITYMKVPEAKITIARSCGFLMYISVFPGSLFAHEMSLLVVYIFCHQFKKLKKHFRHAVGKRGRFIGNLSSFRRRHQMLSRAVGKVDGFLMFGNVGGFVCHIANIIILLYSIMFYRESTATPVSAITHVFWLMSNLKGLFFSATTAILVNHMVCIRCVVLKCAYA